MDLFNIIMIPVSLIIFNTLFSIGLWVSIMDGEEESWLFKIMWIPPVGILFFSSIPLLVIGILLIELISTLKSKYDESIK